MVAAREEDHGNRGAQPLVAHRLEDFIAVAVRKRDVEQHQVGFARPQRTSDGGGLGYEEKFVVPLETLADPLLLESVVFDDEDGVHAPLIGQGNPLH